MLRVMRLQSGLPFRTSTLQLTEATGDLSVQQMTAHTMLVTAQRSITSQTPQYLSDRLQVRRNVGNPALPVRHLREGLKKTTTNLGFWLNIR